MPDPFDTLGLPARFDLDPEAIRAAWHAKVAAASRPGAAAGDTHHARNLALLNDARAALADPERRADALLLRLGGPSREQERGLPPALLAEMLEARETLDAARESGDPDALERSRAWANAERRRRIECVAQLLAPAPAADAISSDALREARIELNALRYAQRMLEQIDEVTT